MQNLNGLRHHTQRNNPQKTTGHFGMDMGVARGVRGDTTNPLGETNCMISSFSLYKGNWPRRRKILNCRNEHPFQIPSYAPDGL